MKVIYAFAILGELLWRLFFNVYALAALVLVVTLGATYIEQKEWDQFVIDRNCKVVSRDTGSVSFVSGGNNGGGTIYQPGKTGWLCDDGVTYFR